MLRHLSDSPKTTAARVSLNTLDIAPQRRRVQCWLNWTAPVYHSHSANRVVLFQENFKSLVNNSSFQCFHIPFVPFREDRLWHQKVWERIRENINLELDWIGVDTVVALVLLYDDKSAALDYLCGLENLSASFTIHFYQIEGPLTWEKTFDVFNSAPDKLSLLDFWVLVPGHESVFGELFELTAVKVQAVLTHVVLVPLEEVEDEVLQLRVVSPINGTRVSH